jgi:hypothetical protein
VTDLDKKNKFNRGRLIFPVGYKSQRQYFSPATPFEDSTVWISEIIRKETVPWFKVGGPRIA